MNNCTFGQSNITNILSISRNGWSLTLIENQLHSMTINCVLETYNNTICIETHNQLHLHAIVYSKWSIINANWQNVRVDDEMRNCLNDILNENYQLTLVQINQELRQRLPRKPTIHDRTVARTLEGMLYRMKLARPLPVERNRPDVLQKRVDYANWFMRHAVVNHRIFVDERGYNIWTARRHGRARMIKRARRQVCGQRGRSVTVALAISPTNGLVFHSAFLGGMNGHLMIFCHR